MQWPRSCSTVGQGLARDETRLAGHIQYIQIGPECKLCKICVNVLYYPVWCRSMVKRLNLSLLSATQWRLSALRRILKRWFNFVVLRTWVSDLCRLYIIWVEKKLLEKFLSPNNFFSQKKILIKKKCWVQKIFLVRKKFWSKESW